jgi:hypothetical protein
MKKTELKKVLKPLIKECIKEALFEEGVLSSVISEVVKGLGTSQQPIVEQKQDNGDETRESQREERHRRVRKINETRQRMLDVVNKDAYNGVDLFEGTSPMAKAGNPNDSMTPQGALAGIEPGDPGVDISRFVGNKNVWKALTGGEKK